MKIAAAKQFAINLAQAILEAEKNGQDEVDLIDNAKALDDEARADLVNAIAEAD